MRCFVAWVHGRLRCACTFSLLFGFLPRCARANVFVHAVGASAWHVAADARRRYVAPLQNPRPSARTPYACISRARTRSQALQAAAAHEFFDESWLGERPENTQRCAAHTEVAMWLRRLRWRRCCS
jgi:hypothetical protein